MKKLYPILLIVVFSIVWSSAFIAGSIALKDFDPFTLLTIRFSLSAFVMLPFFLFLKIKFFKKEAAYHGILIGLLNNALYLGLSFSALEFVRPQVVIVIISCAPIFTSILSASTGIELFSIKKFLGCILGLFGVIIITGISTTNQANSFGIFLATAGMLAFSCGTVIFRGKGLKFPVLQVNFWQSIAGAITLAPFAIVLRQKNVIPSMESIISIAYLIFFVTIGGMSLWLLLIRKSGATNASSYHLLNPFFGSLLSYAFLNHPLIKTDFIGAIFIASGLFLSTYSKKNSPNCKVT
ncbi:DMT family transporter [Comamonas composti]|uniref:DMT family transporter n=1 Tax=Comamonas composti TaxID=408558 RepID=UPI0009FE3150|nr:DMT family transporter [Comamonas composti]